jgi:hypothetical protein
LGRTGDWVGTGDWGEKRGKGYLAGRVGLPFIPAGFCSAMGKAIYVRLMDYGLRAYVEDIIFGC